MAHWILHWDWRAQDPMWPLSMVLVLSQSSDIGSETEFSREKGRNVVAL